MDVRCAALPLPRARAQATLAPQLTLCALRSTLTRAPPARRVIPPASFRYGVQLESATFANRPADYAHMLLCLAAFLLASTALLPAPLLSTSLIMALVYVWSRENQNTPVSFFGIFTVTGFYLPFALLAWTVVNGSDPIPDIRGIIAGHLYYFLASVWPRTGGPTLLRTPAAVRSAVQWAFGCVRGRMRVRWKRGVMRAMLALMRCTETLWFSVFLGIRARGYGYVNPNYVRPAAGPAAFQGRGRRLNE